MKIKAKYKNILFDTTCYKYFHKLEEMNKFFQENRVCKYISHEEGEAVETEARSRGFC